MNHEAEIEGLLAEYLAAEESGSAPPLAEWIDRHSQYREDLLEFFDLRRGIDAIPTPIPGCSTTSVCPVIDSHGKLPTAFGRYTLKCSAVAEWALSIRPVSPPGRVVSLKMSGGDSPRRTTALISTEVEATFLGYLHLSTHCTHSEIASGQ